MSAIPIAGAILAAGIATVVAAAPEVSAQEDEGITFVASVFDLQSRGPVIAAFVAAVEQDLITTTDRHGSFRLTGLNPGRHTIRVWRIGYVETEFSVTLGDQLVSVLDAPVMLAPDPVRVTEVVVEGSRSRVLTGTLAEFHRRRRDERGVFITRDELERSGADRFTDLFRSMPGIDVVQVADLQYTLRTAGSARTGCGVRYWVDGINVEERWAMALRPEGIEAIEVYRRLSEVPAEFPAGGSCGVIVIWTRR